MASILVVEDDPAILNGLLDVFVFHGYEAQGAEDGAEGLMASLGGDHDLIILDVMLPNMDGLLICREIRREKPGQAIIILIPAHSGRRRHPQQNPDPWRLNRQTSPIQALLAPHQLRLRPARSNRTRLRSSRPCRTHLRMA